MKTLYLMRHAKSKKDDPSIEDFDRPLSKRGETDTPFMGALMHQKGILPQEIISSPAERAFATARLFCGELGYPLQNVKLDNSLYSNSSGEILSLIKNLNENTESVVLIGHNPALTNLVNFLSDTPVEGIPTCGIVELIFTRKSWQEIELGSCQLGFFEYPKKYYED